MGREMNVTAGQLGVVAAVASTESRRRPGDELLMRFPRLIGSWLQRSPGVGREMNYRDQEGRLLGYVLQRSPGVGREMNPTRCRRCIRRSGFNGVPA